MFQVNSMQVFNNFSLTLSVKSLKSVTKQPAKTGFSLHSSLLTTRDILQKRPLRLNNRDFIVTTKNRSENLLGSSDWLTHQLYKTVIICFAVAHLQKNSKFYHSRLGGTLTRTNLHYLPYDYQINKLLCKLWFMSSILNFCRLGAHIPPAKCSLWGGLRWDSCICWLLTKLNNWIEICTTGEQHQTVLWSLKWISDKLENHQHHF